MSVLYLKYFPISIYCCCHLLNIGLHWCVYCSLLNWSHWGTLCVYSWVLLLQTTNILGPKFLCAWVANFIGFILTVNCPILWPSCLKGTWPSPVALITIFSYNVWIWLFQVLSMRPELGHWGLAEKAGHSLGYLESTWNFFRGASFISRLTECFCWGLDIIF